MYKHGSLVLVNLTIVGIRACMFGCSDFVDMSYGRKPHTTPKSLMLPWIGIQVGGNPGGLKQTTNRLRLAEYDGEHEYLCMARKKLLLQTKDAILRWHGCCRDSVLEDWMRQTTRPTRQPRSSDPSRRRCTFFIQNKWTRRKYHTARQRQDWKVPLGTPTPTSPHPRRALRTVPQ